MTNIKYQIFKTRMHLHTPLYTIIVYNKYLPVEPVDRALCPISIK
jgi:hypothetical protein